MDNGPIRLLVAEDSLETCEILAAYFSMIPEIVLCGVAHDGEEALYLVGQCQPDVLLLDLIMPKTDGLAVLERLTRAELEQRPRVIVASAVGQESFTAAALGMGAVYYMIKPYDLKDLLGRICMAAAIGEAHRPAAARTPPAHWESTIARTLLELGIPAHMLGYRYCVAAVQRLIQEPGHPSIVKDIYADIAADFTTTAACVEGAIRKAIRHAWGDAPAAFGTMGAAERPPANGRFLSTLAQRLRLAGGEQLAGQ